jgi:hypothetical protein
MNVFSQVVSHIAGESASPTVSRDFVHLPSTTYGPHIKEQYRSPKWVDEDYERVNTDFENVEKSVCAIRGVSPDTARRMAPHDSGCYTYLHEEDAYATAAPVDSYWADANALFLREPGICTDKYSEYIAKIGAKGND